MNKLIKCEPERLNTSDEGQKLSPPISLSQGGLVNGKPTVSIEITLDDGRVIEGRYYCSDLRLSVDFLEPARSVKPKKKPKPRLGSAVLARPVTPAGGHRD